MDMIRSPIDGVTVVLTVSQVVGGSQNPAMEHPKNSNFTGQSFGLP